MLEYKICQICPVVNKEEGFYKGWVLTDDGRETREVGADFCYHRSNQQHRNDTSWITTERPALNEITAESGGLRTHSPALSGDFVAHENVPTNSYRHRHSSFEPKPRKYLKS